MSIDEYTVNDLMASFMHDVTKVTASLFYLLEGLELMQALPPQSKDNEGPISGALTAPCLSGLKIVPMVSVEHVNELIGPSGDAEQLALKGWVVDVYNRWERHRGDLQCHLGDNAILPEIPCMGDFRHIRNDIVHSGFATMDHCGKCAVLTWFTPTEQITMTIDYVLDFLHQMNLLQLPWKWTDDNENTKQFGWELAPWYSDINDDDGTIPKLISLRTSVDHDGEDGTIRYMMSCVFADGVFGMGDLKDLVDVPIDPERFREGRIGPDSDIRFPGEHAIAKRILYKACIGYLRGDSRPGQGIRGPWATFHR